MGHCLCCQDWGAWGRFLSVRFRSAFVVYFFLTLAQFGYRPGSGLGSSLGSGLVT